MLVKTSATFNFIFTIRLPSDHRTSTLDSKLENLSEIIIHRIVNYWRKICLLIPELIIGKRASDELLLLMPAPMTLRLQSEALKRGQLAGVSMRPLVCHYYLWRM